MLCQVLYSGVYNSSGSKIVKSKNEELRCGFGIRTSRQERHEEREDKNTRKHRQATNNNEETDGDSSTGREPSRGTKSEFDWLWRLVRSEV